MGRIVVAALVLLVLGATTTLGVSVSSTTVDSLAQGGTVPKAALVIDGERLNYSGLDVTAATLDITNTDSRTHVADIGLVLQTSDGTPVTTAVETSVRFAPDSTKPVMIDIPATNVSTFDSVEVRIRVSN